MAGKSIRLAQENASDSPSRDAILEAAARIMAVRGFSGTSISAICKAAGYPASSLYWHFSSKENLFAEVVRAKSNQFFSIIPRRTGADARTIGTMEEIAEMVGRALQEDPLFLRVLMLLGLERQDMPPEVREVIREIRETARHWWMTALEAQFAERGAETARAVARDYAEFSRSVIDGAFFAWDFGDGPDLQRVFEQLFTLFDALNARMAAEEGASPITHGRRASVPKRQGA